MKIFVLVALFAAVGAETPKKEEKTDLSKVWNENYSTKFKEAHEKLTKAEGKPQDADSLDQFIAAIKASDEAGDKMEEEPLKELVELAGKVAGKYEGDNETKYDKAVVDFKALFDKLDSKYGSWKLLGLSAGMWALIVVVVLCSAGALFYITRKPREEDD